jgi:membrane protein implicated in regulation of membrane protease activity
MDSRGGREREGGGVPIDLVLVLLIVVAALAAGAWYTIQSGSLAWLLVAAAFAVAVYFVTRPTRRRHRVDADGRRRQVGHDESWTSGRKEER